MPAPFSRDLRTRIGRAIIAGAATGAIANRFGVSARTVRRYRRQLHATGSLAPRPTRGRPPQVVIERDRLIAQLTTQPMATLAAHCQAWTASTGQLVSATTMWRAIRAVGWTRKKGQWQPGNGTRPFGLPGARPSPR